MRFRGAGRWTPLHLDRARLVVSSASSHDAMLTIFVFSVQTWWWHQSFHLMLSKTANKHIFQINFSIDRHHRLRERAFSALCVKAASRIAQNVILFDQD